MITYYDVAKPALGSYIKQDSGKTPAIIITIFALVIVLALAEKFGAFARYVHQGFGWGSYSATPIFHRTVLQNISRASLGFGSLSAARAMTMYTVLPSVPCNDCSAGAAQRMISCLS